MRVSEYRLLEIVRMLLLGGCCHGCFEAYRSPHFAFGLREGGSFTCDHWLRVDD